MIKNTLKNLLGIFLVVLFVSSCNKDDEGLDQTSLKLIGVWETAGGVQLNVSITNLTNDELVEYEEDINTYLNAYVQDFFGTFEFKADLTYTSTLGNNTETGTWAVINEETAILLAETGSTEPTQIEIVSLNATRLVIGIEELDSSDFNNDGTQEEITLQVEVTFDKVN